MGPGLAAARASGVTIHPSAAGFDRSAPDYERGRPTYPGEAVGWVVGMGYGLYLLWLIPNPASGRAHFGGSALTLDKLTLLGWHPFAGSPVQIYVGFVALVLNLIVAVLVTLALRATHVSEGEDGTHPADYHADEGSRRLRPVAPVVAGTSD